MDSHAENTKRIAKNTLMLYVRMLFGMVVSLYTSRVVLNTLGVEDYGIYNVVGGFVVMFSVISHSLSSSVSRFLTFELGRGDMVQLRTTFSSSFWVHIALAGLLLVLAESIGVWFLNTKMIIPIDRIYAANWVFQASLISFVISICCVPYYASVISHERMTAFAYMGISDIVLRLLVVLFVGYSGYDFDKLIVYALLLAGVNIFIQCIYIWYCRWNFEECRLYYHFNKQCWKEICTFAGWNFIGSSAGLLKEQGVNILLNLFMGPVINAARGVANSVNIAVGAFAGNFMAALTPQITKSYASEKYDYTISLAERGSRFSFYILLILALPVLFETEFILTLWLGQFPEHTVSFVRLILILSLCEILSTTLINMQQATGEIRNYQLAVGGVLLMNFPLSYVFLKVGFPPEFTYIVAIFISICCLLLRLLFLRHSIGMSVTAYLRKVCLNVAIVSSISALLPIVLLLVYHEDGWIRFSLVCFLCFIGSILAVYTVGCSTDERQFVKSIVRTIKSKFLHLFSRKCFIR